MRNVLFVATVVLFSCARTPAAPMAPLEQDESIVFPENFGAAPVVGRAGMPSTLEGVTLQALLVAVQDFLPPTSKESPCWSRPDAYVYQVLRQGDVVFIEIHADPAACQGQFLMLDSGIRYAVSVDGRILRRLQTGAPEGPRLTPTAADAGVDGGTKDLDLSNVVVAPPGTSAHPAPWTRQDGGVLVDGGVAAPPP